MLRMMSALVLLLKTLRVKDAVDFDGVHLKTAQIQQR